MARNRRRALLTVLQDDAGGGGGAAFAGAYDDISSLVHIYEIARRTLTSYAGDLVRLRRDSDDAVMDFGPDSNGDLDTAAITAWLAGATGYAVTVYDQVGSNDITQAVNADQPLYVASGQNSRPVLRFNGTTHYLAGAFSGALSQPFHVYLCGKLATTGVNDGYRNFIDGDDTSNRLTFGQWASVSPNRWAVYAGVTLITDAVTDDSFALWSLILNGASSDVRQNGASIFTGNAGAHNADGLVAGSWASHNSNWWEGDIGGIAIADPVHDASNQAAMEAAINDYWNIAVLP